MGVSLINHPCEGTPILANLHLVCVPGYPKNIKATLFARAAKQLFHTESIKIESGQRLEDHLAHGAIIYSPRNSQILMIILNLDGSYCED